MKRVEHSVEVPSKVAFETPPYLTRRLSFTCSSIRVGLSCRIMGHSYDNSHVECTVEAPIAAAVEAMPDSVPR